MQKRGNVKPVIVHLKLPDDLSEKLRNLASHCIPGGEPSFKPLIVSALRKHWLQKEPEIVILDTISNLELAEIYPTYGSIPAEQKRG